MFPGQIRDALAQVRHLQHSVLSRQRFGGFSGPARAASGTAALAAAYIMATGTYPATLRAHFMGWAAVFVFALLLNGAALLYWFLNDPHVNRHIYRLRPLFDAIPAIAVGGVLTLTLAFNGLPQYLFGVWMCCFGLSNLASRYVLPKYISWVGVFYLLCGMAWLLLADATFLNPWPMGAVFFVGEWAGGLLLYLDERRYLAFVRYQDEEEQQRKETNREI
jgi:hypothetical protein